MGIKVKQARASFLDETELITGHKYLGANTQSKDANNKDTIYSLHNILVLCL